MEPVTRRIALHIYTEIQDTVVAFYRDLVGLRTAKDIVLFTGQRWVVLVKDDNIGVQFHIHTQSPPIAHLPFRVELSLNSEEYEVVRKRFREVGQSFRESDLPYCAAFDVTDPIGNEITLSWWGELEHDDKEGWDTEFLDFDNCTAPPT